LMRPMTMDGVSNWALKPEGPVASP